MKTFAIAAAGLICAISTGAAFADHLNIDAKGATIQGDTVVFPSVRVDKDGYVVVHAMKDGAPTVPASMGHTAVSAGTTENVVVAIEGGVMPGTEYVAMVHYETNGNGTYDYAPGMTDVDTPGMKPDNTAYSQAFMTGM
jgi:hypothetical protein